MHPLQKRFHDFIEKQFFVQKGDRLLLAVSGGLDSMVLLNLFYTSSYDFSVAHCNFGLRGDESDGDEEFVISWTQEREINCYVSKIDLGEGSVQLLARERRYRWFNELCQQHHYTKIVTAHHLDDSMETSLLHLARGTGVAGLKGIPVQQGKVIRPLMFASRNELLDYANEIELNWREDSSNQKTTYDRNKIRHLVIPRLKEINPSLISTYAQTRERLDMAASLVAKEVEKIRSAHFKEATGELDLTWITSSDDLLVLSELLSDFGFNYATSKEIFEARGHAGKTFIAEEYLLQMDRTTAFIQPKASPTKTALMTVNEVGTFSFDEYTYRIEHLESGDVPLNQGNDVALLDAIKAVFPLTIRYWTAGDQFHPLGMKGTKKVSDFLIDNKVPLAHKSGVMVVESAGEIVWVVGHRISELHKIIDPSLPMIRIEKVKG